MKKTLYLLLIIVCSNSFPVTGQHTNIQPVAILGAFEAEIKLLQSKVSNQETYEVMGVKFISGQLNGRQVIVAQTGIGKVNAAMTTTLVIQQFKPSAIIFTGIAGSVNPKLQPGDIVIAEKTAQHDYGAFVNHTFETRPTRNPVNLTENPIFFPADLPLIQAAEKAAKETTFEPASTSSSRTPIVVKGIVVTGDAFISSKQKRRRLRKDFDADATEMEGAAVAQICRQQQVPFLIIRSMSDTAGKDARITMHNFYEVAARNSANLVISILGLSLN